MADSKEEVTKVTNETNEGMESSSPETRLIPEDLSVNTTKSKENNVGILPLKTPELKLSVRKLLGCSPSPPPVTSDLSPKAENETINRLASDSKISNLDSKIPSQFSRSFRVHDESTKGKNIFKRNLRLIIIFLLVRKTKILINSKFTIVMHFFTIKKFL